jgi:hypothetical protein
MSPLTTLFERLRGALRSDDRNIAALAERLGCSLDDAARVYHLARRDGFGSAYRQVFGTDVDPKDPSPD